MGLPELRVFLGDDRLLTLLDEALQLPLEPITQAHKPTLRQAIELVCTPPVHGFQFDPLDGELGPWIEAFAAVIQSGRASGGYLMRSIVRTIARPNGIAALGRLTHDDVLASVRIAAFESFSKARIDPPADVLARGAVDPSAKVRAFAAKMQPEQPAAATSDAALLEELVALWRETRQPEVADLIEIAAAQLPHAQIEARSTGEREAQWQALAKARSAATLSSLLATPWPTKWRDGLERLNALKEWSDPRIAVLLRKTLEAPPYTSNAANRFFFRLAAALTDIPDVRQQPSIAALKLEERFRGYLHYAEIRASSDGTRLAETLAREPQLPYTSTQRALFDRARAELASSAQQTRTTQRNEADLLAEIYANPDADAPRLVYADFLEERDDPRGQLIVLQCSPATAESKKLERALIKRHEDKLAGPIAPFIQKSWRQFERGFLATCRCELGGFRNGQSEPGWATLRAISFAENSGYDLAAFVAGQQAASLRALYGLTYETAALIKSERIEAISYQGHWQEQAHAALPNLPNLRRLGVLVGHFARDWEQPLVAGALWPTLERFAVNEDFKRLEYWIAQLATATRMKQLVLHESGQNVFLEEPAGWTVTLSPGAKVKITVELRGRSYDAVSEAIAALQKGSFELVIVPSRALEARTQEHAALVRLAG